MEIALDCGAIVIGVNNRNLHNFQLGTIITCLIIMMMTALLIMLIIMTMLILIIYSYHHLLLFLTCMLTINNYILYVDMNTTERVIEVLTKRNIKWRKTIVDVDDNINNYDDDSGYEKKHDSNNSNNDDDNDDNNNNNNQTKNKYKFQTATQIAATANKNNDICLAALSGITCYEDVEKLQSLGKTYILK
jgi:hypothetical protein